MIETTLAIIKPDAVARGISGEIIRRIEAAGFKLVAIRRIHLTRAHAESFYDVHKSKPFFNGLCEYMTSGPIIVMALQTDGAIGRWRDLMGATDPKKAAAGTIRAEFGVDVEKNATHGSDAPETSAREIAFFFSGIELLG